MFLQQAPHISLLLVGVPLPWTPSGDTATKADAPVTAWRSTQSVGEVLLSPSVSVARERG